MIGIDEVGRGAWAGPLLVVAARLKKGQKLPSGLKDSKLLSKKQRNILYEKLIGVCEFAEGWVSAEVIDQLGLTASLKSATLLAMFQLHSSYSEPVIIDGTVDFLAGSRYTNAQTRIKADQTVAIVSAASIYAKVKRDALLSENATDYPEYGFEHNVGYGTPHHLQALQKYGLTRLHRRTYAPVKKILLDIEDIRLTKP